jgi:hypothetical protein
MAIVTDHGDSDMAIVTNHGDSTDHRDVPPCIMWPGGHAVLELLCAPVCLDWVHPFVEVVDVGRSSTMPSYRRRLQLADGPLAEAAVLVVVPTATAAAAAAGSLTTGARPCVA